MSSPTISISIETVSSTNTSQKRHRIFESSGVRRPTGSSSNTERKKNGVAVLLNLDDFKCTCCLLDMTGDIYQCSNGHSICSVCHGKKLRRCAICRMPTPMFHQNLAMEGVLEVVRVPCPNAEFGCSKYLPFDELNNEISEHLEQCLFTQCSCPFRRCKFIGSYQELYKHCVTKHLESLKMFECGKFLNISFANDDRVVLKEMFTYGGELLVVDCYNKEGGTKITSTTSANCIAPNVLGMGDFCYILRLSTYKKRLILQSDVVERNPRVTVEVPNNANFLPVPSYMDRSSVLKIKRCIYRRAWGIMELYVFSVLEFFQSMSSSYSLLKRCSHWKRM